MTTLLTPEATRTRDYRPPAARPGWVLPVVNAVAWAAFLGLAMSVQPPLDPNAPIDALAAVVSMTLWMSLFAAVVGLAGRNRSGYAATGVGGVMLVAAAVSCWAGGHSGMWLVTQGLAGLGLATTGVASWRVSG